MPPSPSADSRPTANSGTRNWARPKAIWTTPLARPRKRFGTSCGTAEFQASRWKVSAVDSTAISTYACHTASESVRYSSSITAWVRPAATSPYSMIRRRSPRSTSAPASGAVRMPGTSPQAASRPNCASEPVVR